MDGLPIVPPIRLNGTQLTAVLEAAFMEWGEHSKDRLRARVRVGVGFPKCYGLSLKVQPYLINSAIITR